MTRAARRGDVAKRIEKKAPAGFTLRLSDSDWERVFAARCKAKQGQTLTDAEHTLVRLAFAMDRKRYNALAGPVFDATAPFGSTRARRSP